MAQKPSRRAKPDSESALLRWSRRKSEATSRSTPTEVASIVPTPTAPVTAEKPLTDADMPPIESLHPDSDYSGFLSPQVSEKVRRAALRKLFQSPQFNICDGLDDYAGDFRNFLPLGDIVTADMRYHLERELQALKEKSAVEPPAENATQSTRAETSDKTVLPESRHQAKPKPPQQAATTHKLKPRKKSKAKSHERTAKHS